MSLDSMILITNIWCGGYHAGDSNVSHRVVIREATIISTNYLVVSMATTHLYSVRRRVGKGTNRLFGGPYEELPVLTPDTFL